MKEVKRILIAICVIGTLSQSTPSANAQAAALPGVAQGLTQLGMSLAGAVAPLLIPIAATVLINGVRYGMMVPGIVKEKVSNMSVPKLRRHKQVANADTADGATEEESPAEPPKNASTDNGAAIARGDYASASVSGEVMSATETRQAEEEAQESQEEQEPPRPQRRQKPADSSDWYQE